MRAKYAEYGVKHDPFVIVKPDAGTYGMGHHDGEGRERGPPDCRAPPAQQDGRDQGRHGSLDVLVQEGVYTFEHIHEAVAEPVVYMVDHYVVGGFYRVHTERGTDENLNAPGCPSSRWPSSPAARCPTRTVRRTTRPTASMAYGVVARLALLAASLEIGPPEITRCTG